MFNATIVDMTTKAIDTSSDFLSVKGLENREKELLTQIGDKTGFVAENNIWKSSYWGSKQIGAANYLGTYKGKAAVLKIQGAKPMMSEIDVLEKFEAQNESKKVRTAKLYDYIRWSDADQFEALVLEYIDGPKVVESGKPTNQAAINEFLDFYRDYRMNCRNRPWLAMPDKAPEIRSSLVKAAKIREDIYPNHPLRTAEDDTLIESSMKILEPQFKTQKLEFVHGHLSVEDVFKVNPNGFVIFSNLFWGWKSPFSDLLFGYHWFLQTLERFDGTTRALIEDQREMWLEEMQALPEVRENQRDFLVARLEKAVSGLAIDAYAYIDPKNPAALPLIESTRDQVRKLTSELK